MRILTTLIKPPQTPLERPQENAWQTVEKKLGLELPSDYKEFINTYGTGTIDNFLWVLNPFSDNKFLNLLHQRESILQALRQLQSEIIPYPLYPDLEGILPWGITDNGDVLYWHCAGQSSSWSVVVNESRGSRWREYQCTTVEFLIQVMRKDLTVDIFPDDFPSDIPEFFNTI